MHKYIKTTIRFRLSCIRRSSHNFFKEPRIGILILLVSIVSLLLVVCVEALTTPTGTPEMKAVSPSQPLSGPGGADYEHAGVTVSGYGKGENQYWIFEPASPTPESAPLIVFNHGLGVLNPVTYGAWIEHLVRHGNIVVYPRYQAYFLMPASEIIQTSQNPIIAVKDAIERLQSGEHVIPQLDKFAIVGHSLGAAITANMASRAASEGLPEPKAIMTVCPPIHEAAYRNLSQIPATTLLLVVACQEDQVTPAECGLKIFYGTPQISVTNKDFITLVSDYHGEPPLIADHFAPVAPDERYNVQDMVPVLTQIQRRVEQMTGTSIDALDYGLWKLFDGLTDAAFYNKNWEYALGNTTEQRFMGEWNDGTPVIELEVSDSP